ncbi:MAG: restriction endonuclease [Candidatus Loosdrechtia sp.]|uniref:restriction endonuclease n=1 Tax=Candidatus Loosdrechtia sp. TaxID=3101272 RepID=UPI003A7AB9CA|nr:MAG: restriction endonuclease [Candidatus Jettenia sp. AMX2]
MEIPKFHETFVPILETLADGRIVQHRELLNKVVEKYYSKLPQELLEKKTKTGDLLLLNRIAWGKSYLKKAGYIHYPERGAVQITQKGKEVSKDKVNLKDIISESGIFNFYQEERAKEFEDLEIKGSSPQDLIDTGFSAIEAQVKSDLLDKLKNADPFYFEKVILILLGRMGYGESIETSKTGDSGIDGIINQDKLGLEKIYIQAKRYNENKVREKDIRNFIGAMSGDTTKGVFVTTSEFDQQAIKKAHDAHHTIILIDGRKLVDLLYQYGVGVQVQNTYDVKAVDDNFFETN